MPPQQPNPTKRVVDFDELYPGRFLKAADCKGRPVVLTIADVYMEELEGDGGKKYKGIVSFEKTEKQLVLNKTNGILLKELFGREVPKWVGHKVAIHPTEWNGEPCIRVYGSPELAEDKQVLVQLPKRKPITMTLRAMPAVVQGGRAQGGAATRAGSGSGSGTGATHGEISGEEHRRRVAILRGDIAATYEEYEAARAWADRKRLTIQISPRKLPADEQGDPPPSDEPPVHRHNEDGEVVPEDGERDPF